MKSIALLFALTLLLASSTELALSTRMPLPSYDPQEKSKPIHVKCKPPQECCVYGSSITDCRMCAV
ncbi:uncharacterized protein A4U43_UnF80, partial [Asparagus officinalis]